MSHPRPLQRLFLVLSLLLVLACACTPASGGASPTPARPAAVGGLETGSPPAATLTLPSSTVAATPTLRPTPAPSSPGSASGQVVLYVAQYDVWRVRVDGTAPERLTQGVFLEDGEFARIPLWEAMRYAPPRAAPDGRWLACSNGTQLLVASVPAGGQRVVGTSNVALYDWAPDSSALAFATLPPPWEPPAEIHIYDPQRDTLETPITLKGERNKIDHLVWSSDSRDLAFSCCFQAVEPYTETGRSVGQVRRLDVGTQQVETAGEIELRVAATSRLCWTEAGGLIASPQRPSPGQAVRCSPEPYGISLISPDGGRWLELSRLSADLTGTRLVVPAYEAGTATAPLWQREYPEVTLARGCWSPDGQYLLLDDSEPHSPIWRLRADGTGELEMVVEDGFLIDAIPAWQ